MSGFLKRDEPQDLRAVAWHHARAVTSGYLAKRIGVLYRYAQHARWRPDGLRPLLELEPCEHPVYRDKSEAIALERAIAMAATAIHATDRPDN